jgi:hypothetical protein
MECRIVSRSQNLLTAASGYSGMYVAEQSVVFQRHRCKAIRILPDERSPPLASSTIRISGTGMKKTAREGRFPLHISVAAAGSYFRKARNTYFGRSQKGSVGTILYYEVTPEGAAPSPTHIPHTRSLGHASALQTPSSASGSTLNLVYASKQRCGCHCPVRDSSGQQQ